MRRFQKTIVLGLIVGAIGVLVRPTRLGLQLEENVALRWLFTIRGPVQPPPDVAVVSIDKGSAQQLGLDTSEWPPPRHVHADVIRALASRRVAAIAVDIRFEKRRSSIDDADLADAIHKSGKVALAQHIDLLSVPGTAVEIEQIRSPVDELQKSAFSLAPFPLPEGPPTHFFWTFFKTSAGEVPTLPAVTLQIQALPVMDRFIALLERAGLNDLDLPSHLRSVADSRRLMDVLRRELGSDQRAAVRALTLLRAGEGSDLSAGERRVLTSLLKLYAGRRTHYLNFYGPAGSIETIPVHELLQDGRGERFALAGKAVFVGEGASELVTSAEQRDTYRTIYSTNEGVDLSGAEIGATAFANLLTDRVLRPVNAGAATAILFGFGFFIGILSRLLPGAYAVAVVVVVAAAYSGSAQFLFTERALLVPLAIPLVAQVPLALFTGIFSRYRDIRKQVPVEIDPSAPPQEYQGVCLATDVRGFTTIAEVVKPNELAPLLDEYYDMLRRLVARRHGLTWGRAGDSAMCVWKGSKTSSRLGRMAPRRLTHGSTHADKKARLSACLAAIEMRDAIDQFNERLAPTRRLQTRIGLDAGVFALGAVGGELQAVGNPVNTAARIEGLNKLLSTKVLASERVVQSLPGLVVRRLGFFPLSGKSGEICVFELVGQEAAVSEATIRLGERFAAGLKLYEQRNWSDAAKFFQQLALDYPDDGPTNYYRDGCERQAALPPDLGSIAHLDPR